MIFGTGLISASAVAVIILGTILLIIYRTKSSAHVERPTGCVCPQGCIRPKVCPNFKSKRCAMRIWKDTPQIALFCWWVFFPVFVFAGIVNGLAAPSHMGVKFRSMMSYWKNLRPTTSELGSLEST